MNILAITQARYGSSRLPAKILKEINGVSLLEIHLRRILRSKLISKLKVATTTESGAEHIIAVAEKLGVETFQGSVTDVLDRFYKTAVSEQPDYVVRLTSDCPLIDPVVIDKVIKVCVDSDCDYVSNAMEPTYPDGLDVEICRFTALSKAHMEAVLTSDREHVTPYIWRNSSFKGAGLFKSDNVSHEIDYSGIRMTVDTLDDFTVIKHLVEALGYEKPFEDYVQFLNTHKDVMNINQYYARNEGYVKSLLND